MNGSFVQDLGETRTHLEKKEENDFENNFEQKNKMDAKANHFSFKFKEVNLSFIYVTERSPKLIKGC